MAKDWARGFYNSKAWDDCRKAYTKSRRGLCERCLAKGIIKPGKIVHHRQHLTPENITDPAVALCWDNLQLVCKECHEEIHRGERRYRVDTFGHVMAV